MIESGAIIGEGGLLNYLYLPTSYMYPTPSRLRQGHQHWRDDSGISLSRVSPFDTYFTPTARDDTSSEAILAGDMKVVDRSRLLVIICLEAKKTCRIHWKKSSRGHSGADDLFWAFSDSQMNKVHEGVHVWIVPVCRDGQGMPRPTTTRFHH